MEGRRERERERDREEGERREGGKDSERKRGRINHRMKELRDPWLMMRVRHVCVPMSFSAVSFSRWPYLSVEAGADILHTALLPSCSCEMKKENCDKKNLWLRVGV